MLVLGEHRNTLGSEDGVDAEALQEIGSSGPEEEAELRKSEQSHLAELLDNVGDLLYQSQRSVVAQKTFSIHVSSPSFVVY